MFRMYGLTNMNTWMMMVMTRMMIMTTWEGRDHIVPHLRFLGTVVKPDNCQHCETWWLSSLWNLVIVSIVIINNSMTMVIVLVIVKNCQERHDHFHHLSHHHKIDNNNDDGNRNLWTYGWRRAAWAVSLLFGLNLSNVSTCELSPLLTPLSPLSPANCHHCYHC